MLRVFIQFCVLSALIMAHVPMTRANVLSNGDFTGSLSGWTEEGTVFNTGNQAVFSDSVASPTGLFQSVAVGAEFAGFQISFDVLTGGLSPTVSPGFLPDSFFATVYLGTSVFGPSLSGAAFDESVALFDQDRDGFFGVAAGATFGASPKGSQWTRYTLTMATAGLFAGAGFLTVAFQFFDLNGVVSDSTAAVDNVDVRVISAPLRWRLPGDGVWDTGVTANWRLLSGGIDRVFESGVQAVFDGEGGVITVDGAGLQPGAWTVAGGGYVFRGGAVGGLTGLNKSGSGWLMIESANTYSGGTVIMGDGVGASGLDCFCSGGVLETLFCGTAGSVVDPGAALWVMNEAGSATGSGPVQVNAGGMLGGVGVIEGAVTAFGSSGGKARVVPGSMAAPISREVLSLGGGLNVGAEAEVVFRLGEQGVTGLVVTGEVQVQAGAKVRVVLEGTFVPQPGAVFGLIDVVGGGISLADPAALDLPAGIDWDSSDFSSLGVLRVRGAALALEIKQQPVPLTVRPGETATFAVSAVGTGPLMYRWQKDGVNIPGEVGATLTLSAAAASDEGDYHCVVFNGAESVTSDVGALLVRGFSENHRCLGGCAGGAG
jgi:autotransporter-associated beta strand protein